MSMEASKFCWADASAEEDEQTSWQADSCEASSRQSSSDYCSDDRDTRFSMLELSQEGLQDGSGQLSSDAPEFIPTLSAACPAVCVGTLCVENKSLESTSSSRFQHQSCPMLAQRRKVQFACLEVPARMVVRGEDDTTSSQGVMPDASEDEWLRRRETRIRAVSVAKNTREYQSHSRSKLDAEYFADEPLTPDPADRTISARRWKYEVHQWRSALTKSWEQDAHRSMVSTEDGVSDTVSSAATDEF